MRASKENRSFPSSSQRRNQRICVSFRRLPLQIDHLFRIQDPSPQPQVLRIGGRRKDHVQNSSLFGTEVLLSRAAIRREKRPSRTHRMRTTMRAQGHRRPRRVAQESLTVFRGQ